MMRLLKYFGFRTFKTGIAATAAMTIAVSFGLKYAAAAGIIAILSVQTTKRHSLKLAAQRMGACILALFISSILFGLLGYNTLVFGLFLFIFIPISAMFNFNEGIVVNSVLVTHLLVERSIAPSLMLNELILMSIGIGVALILNLHMPSLEKKIKEDQYYIEAAIKGILMNMSDSLRNNAVSIKEEDLFKNLEVKLKEGKNRAYRNFNNALWRNDRYYIKYMDMRLSQFEILKNMRKHFNNFFITYEQSLRIADFTENVSNSLHEYNTAEGLLKNLYTLKESFASMELPKTREEFENRAMLYQFLNDLESFLIIKNEFKKNIKNDQFIDVY
jgi:uncharacterized membrane protein YgaE (UPF0421/DUF939 family)